MQRFILTENIRLFRKQLEAGAEGSDRRRLETMLAAAERELARFDAATSGARAPWEQIPAAELEAARREIVAWFRNAYAGAPVLAALIDPDAGLTMVEVNRTYEISSGRTREEIVGKSLFALFPDNPNDPRADGVRNLFASLRTVAETGRSHEMGLQRYDTQDAAGAWAARYWRPVNTPLHDDKGRLVLLLHVVEEAAAPQAT
jgi:PAS domain-containing protein